VTGLLLLLAALAAPVWASTATADGTLGNDAQTPTAYGSSVLVGQLAGTDLLGGGQLLVGYVPRLTLSGAPQSSGASRVALFQTGSVAYQLRDGTERYGLAEAVSFGEQDFSLLNQPLAAGVGSGLPPPALPGQTSPDRLPGRRFISTLSSLTSASLQELFSPRLRASAQLNFSVGGGQGSFGRMALPLQRSGAAQLASSFDLTRLDTLSVTGRAAASLTAGTRESGAAQLELGWARAFSAHARGSAALGLSVLYNNAATAAATSGTLASPGVVVGPAATSSLVFEVPLREQRLAFGADGVLEPALDPLSGTTYLRGTGRFTASFSPEPDWTLSASAVGNRILGGVLSGAWGAGVDAELTHRLSANSSIHAGFRAALLTPTHLLFADEDPSRQWAVLAGFTAAFPGSVRR